MVDNVSYDVLTVLQSKLEALAAYDQYVRDCRDAGDEECRQLLEQIRHDDQEHVERLKGELERLVRDGRLRSEAHASNRG